MNAAELLKATRAEGVALSHNGDKLVLEWKKSPPTPTLVENLRRHKAEILSFLKNEPSSWSAEDWLAYFDERAGIAEFDAGFSRIEAELSAFLDCVDRWLAMNPPIIEKPHLCLQCGLPAQGKNKIEAAGAAGKHGFLHAACADKWNVSRRTHARRQLRWLLEQIKG
jgi:hypothetical protein